MSSSEKKSEHEDVRHFLYKKCNLEVSRCSGAKQRKRTKKVCSKCKVTFLLIRPTAVFSPFSLPSPPNVMLHWTIRNDDFLAQRSVATFLRHCFEGLQHCSSIATLCCANNGRCESSRATSALHDFIFCLSKL